MLMRFAKVTLTFLFLVYFTACGTPKYTDSSMESRAAILDAVNIYLNSGQCEKAIELIDPLYNSAQTDNEVRYARAASYGCAAGVSNFFSTTTAVLANRLDAAVGEGSYLWRTASKIFYPTGLWNTHPSFSTNIDRRIVGAANAMDALMSVVKKGVVVSTTNKINASSANPGSLSYADREDDANLTMLFVSLAGVGAVQNRYSDTQTAASYKKSRNIGWTMAKPNGFEIAADIGVDGCIYAASVLNVFDSFSAVENILPKNLKDAFTAIKAIQTLLDAACEAGCTGAINSGCSLPSGSCTTCPASLKYWNSCSPTVANDKNSCAAAGIIRFLDTNTNVGWFGP